MSLIKKIPFFVLVFLFIFQKSFSDNSEIYKKIDLFGEVLEKINDEYVDEIDGSFQMCGLCTRHVNVRCAHPIRVNMRMPYNFGRLLTDDQLLAFEDIILAEAVSHKSFSRHKRFPGQYGIADRE